MVWDIQTNILIPTEKLEFMYKSTFSDSNMIYFKFYIIDHNVDDYDNDEWVQGRAPSWRMELNFKFDQSTLTVYISSHISPIYVIDISDHWQFDYLFNSLFRHTTKKQ